MKMALTLTTDSTKKFKKLVKRKQLNRDKFPLAKRGLVLAANFQKSIVFVFIALILFGTTFGIYKTNVITNLFQDGQTAPTQSQQTITNSAQYNDILSVFTDTFKTVVDVFTSGGQKNVAYPTQQPPDAAPVKPTLTARQKAIKYQKMVVHFFEMVFLFSLGLCGYTFLRYRENIIRRARLFEMHIMKNDFAANRLKKNLINDLGINDEWHDFKQERAEAAKSKSKKRRSIDQQEKAFQSLRHPIVMINERFDVDDPSQIVLRHMISFKLPSNRTVAATVQSKLDSLDDVATSSTDGQVKFGKIMLSEDRHHLTVSNYEMRAVEKEDQEEVVAETYESSFPLTVFVDRSKEIEEKTEGAQVWAKQAGKSVDQFLATDKINMSRIKTAANSSNAVFTYHSEFSTSIPQFESMADRLDYALKTHGSSVTMKAGDLTITVPLPKNKVIPTDARSIFADVFGAGEG